MRAEKRKKNAPKELSRLKSILKVDGDVLMKDVQEIATVVEPKHCQEKTQCVVKDETGEFMCFISKKVISTSFCDFFPFSLSSILSHTCFPTNVLPCPHNSLEVLLEILC